MKHLILAVIIKSLKKKISFKQNKNIKSKKKKRQF